MCSYANLYYNQARYVVHSVQLQRISYLLEKLLTNASTNDYIIICQRINANNKKKDKTHDSFIIQGKFFCFIYLSSAVLKTCRAEQLFKSRHLKISFQKSTQILYKSDD